MTETAIQEKPKNEVFDLVSSEAFRDQLTAAMPELGITGARLARVVLTECRRTPKLWNCTAASMGEAVMRCAETGLLPGPMGHCYIIPYYDKNAKVTNATFQLGYKGVVALLWRSGNIATIRAEVVHENDHFEDSIGAPPTWIPSLDDAGAEIGCFATIGTVTGGWITKYWSWNKVIEHGKRYSKQFGKAWTTEPHAMACKTMLIQAAKFAPISTESMLLLQSDQSSNIVDAEIVEPSEMPTAAEVMPEMESD